MFASHALPPPSSFGLEHRPLRLTSDSARQQPQGGCQFKPLSGQHQACLCQTYQHNRSTLGNICDCGHSACYHSPRNDERLADTRVIGALVEKVKKLEDLVIKERASRNNQIIRERQAWEREVRVLREALAPFYQSESELKKRLVELENKVELTYDEHCRLKERMLTIDDAGMALEHHVEGYEFSRTRKRKASIGQSGVMSPASNYTCSTSSASDTTSVGTHKSPRPPSPLNPPLPASIVAASPRSSGVLYLKHTTMNSHEHVSYQGLHRQQQQQQSRPDHEPRSSGFLSIDLTERLRNRQLDATSQREHSLPAINGLYNLARTGLPSPPHSKVSSGALPISDLLSNDTKTGIENRSPKKRKQAISGMTGLELLANAASPLVQQG